MWFLQAQRSSNFLSYSWGQDLNNIRNRLKLKHEYFDGLIYDRILECLDKIDIRFKMNSDCNFDAAHDSVYITGSIESLGKWDIHKAVKLKQRDAEWWITIDIGDSKDQTFEYKFFIARESLGKEKRFLIKQIQLYKQIFESEYSTSHINWPQDLQPIVNGWLLRDQFELHFNFYNCPLKLSNVKDSKTSVKITPYIVHDNGSFERVNDFIFDFTVSIYLKICSFSSFSIHRNITKMNCLMIIVMLNLLRILIFMEHHVCTFF